MGILGKVTLARILKQSNGTNRTPKHSISTGLSTVPASASTSQAPATVNKQSDIPDHDPSADLDQEDSFMQKSNNVIREGLNVLSPIAGGIPVAGTPLKASIDALLVVLNSINVSHCFSEHSSCQCVIEHSGRQGARIEEKLPA